MRGSLERKTLVCGSCCDSALINHPHPLKIETSLNFKCKTPLDTKNISKLFLLCAHENKGSFCCTQTEHRVIYSPLFHLPSKCCLFSSHTHDNEAGVSSAGRNHASTISPPQPPSVTADEMPAFSASTGRVSSPTCRRTGRCVAANSAVAIATCPNSRP